MIEFKLEIPNDYSEQVRKDCERQLNDQVSRAGYHNVTVRIDRHGKPEYSGDEATVRRLIEENPELFPPQNQLNSDRKIKPAGTISMNDFTVKDPTKL